MGSTETVKSLVQVAVQNIGGISDTSVEFSPGVTVLAGRNATNRTSFLRAIMAALGSDDVALKGDATEGSVELILDGETYTRALDRQNGTVVLDGEPYLQESELADLFAFLLESNDARRAVERGDDLYDVIMRPVDTDEIDAEIDRLEVERQELESELEEIDSLETKLPELEEQRTRLEADIENKRVELEQREAELDGIEGGGGQATELEKQFEQLRETRGELEGIRNDIEDQERIVEALREDRSNHEVDIEALAAVDEGEADGLEAEVQRLREEIQTIESSLSELRAVIQFNESFDQSQPDVISALVDIQTDGEPGSVTDKLLADGEEVVCWTCGSRVAREQVEGTVDLLRDVHSEKIDRRNSLRAEIDELESQRKHIERTREEGRKLRRQLDEVESDLEERTDRIEELQAEAEELETAVADLEAAVDEFETDHHDERLARYREVNELEFERARLESERDDVSADIDSIENRLEERERLEDRMDVIDGEVGDLRSRIERLEQESVEQFNDQMDTILDLLEFDNLERVWIERVETEVTRGRRKMTKDSFDLHVVRTSESGSVYEDTVDHLSESEREVVGLVFALSGYLVHEVYDQVPFMLLDSLEALDSERVSSLIDYLAQHPDNLVVALLPEDAEAVDHRHQRITEI